MSQVVAFRRTAKNADEAFVGGLRDILDAGDDVGAIPYPLSRNPTDAGSGSSGYTTREILNYQVELRDPRDRMISRDRKAFWLTRSVARFVWMMAANNRLSDIQFYAGTGVSHFTDDGILVPGSSYGARMLQPRPGLDQLEGVISRLRSDPGTRRAAISIYQPEDAVRNSNDIPCTFGLMYHIREGKLCSTVIMRSNNATTLMPYNMFEFSLLAELVWAELRATGEFEWLELGALTYNAISFHIYSRELERAEHAVAHGREVTNVLPPTMPYDPVPNGTPFEQLRKLVRLEPKLRQSASSMTPDSFDSWVEEIDREVDGYWRQYFYLLMHSIASQYRYQFALEKLYQLLADEWKAYLGESAFRIAGSVTEPVRNLLGEDLRLVAAPTVGEQLTSDGSLLSFAEARSRRLVKDGLPPIDILEYRAISDLLTRRLQGFAARDGKFTEDDFESAFLQIRRVHVQEPLL